MAISVSVVSVLVLVVRVGGGRAWREVGLALEEPGRALGAALNLPFAVRRLIAFVRGGAASRGLSWRGVGISGGVSSSLVASFESGLRRGFRLG